MAEIHNLPGASAPPVKLSPAKQKRPSRPGAQWKTDGRLRAAYEIEAIATLMQRELVGADQKALPIWSLALRLEALAEILMSLDDDLETEKSIAMRLYGREAAHSQRS